MVSEPIVFTDYSRRSWKSIYWWNGDEDMEITLTKIYGYVRYIPTYLYLHTYFHFYKHVKLCFRLHIYVLSFIWYESKNARNVFAHSARLVKFSTFIIALCWFVRTNRNLSQAKHNTTIHKQNISTQGQILCDPRQSSRTGRRIGACVW